jgi:hypothetical protein
MEPVVEAEVAYSTLTEKALLREAVFNGVREDQQSPAPPAPLRRPSRAESSRRQTGVPRENILQLLPDAVQPSKEELAAYWARSGLPLLGRHRSAGENAARSIGQIFRPCLARTRRSRTRRSASSGGRALITLSNSADCLLAAIATDRRHFRL